MVRKYFFIYSYSINYIKLYHRYTYRKISKICKDKSYHWNDYGAFLAYKEIMKELNKIYPNIKAKDIENFTIEINSSYGGDLAIMLSLDNIIKGEKITFKAKNSIAKNININYNKNITGLRKNGIITKSTNDTKLPNAIMICDSFSTALIPFLSEHFNNITYIRTYDIDKDFIKYVNPDIILILNVERNIKNVWMVR